MCIDYLNLTVPNGIVSAIVKEWCAFLGVSAGVERKNGIHGYERSMDIGGHCIVGYGGTTQKGTVLVSVNGSGCNRVHSFDSVRAWAESVHARITRLDIAADDHDGRTFSVQGALTAWRAGAFKVPGRGRGTAAELVDDLGSGRGCTLYVGTRLAGKLVRVYEKGKQLKDAASSWVRAELELHAKDRVIPYEALSNPVPYLAASYPFFEFLSLAFAPIHTMRKASVVTLQSLAKWVRSVAGKTFNPLLVDAAGDVGELVMRLRRDGIPKKLVPYFNIDGSALHAA